MQELTKKTTEKRLTELKRDLESKDTELNIKNKEIEEFKKQFDDLKINLEKNQKELEEKDNEFFEHQQSLLMERKMTMQL